MTQATLKMTQAEIKIQKILLSHGGGRGIFAETVNKFGLPDQKMHRFPAFGVMKYVYIPNDNESGNKSILKKIIQV